ncbi:hypothetical protein, partial [Photobacterium obscurum]
KGAFFRRDKLAYSEIGKLDKAAEVLKNAGFIIIGH